MRWVSIIALLLAAFLRTSANYDGVLQFVVCAGAIVVAWEAFRTARYFWAIGFAAIAMLFNPIQPFNLSPAQFLWLDLFCIGAFVVSVAVLKKKSGPANYCAYTL